VPSSSKLKHTFKRVLDLLEIIATVSATRSCYSCTIYFCMFVMCLVDEHWIESREYLLHYYITELFVVKITMEYCTVAYRAFADRRG